MTQRTSIDAFYYIRVLACFGIILLHALFASNVYFGETMTQGQLLTSKTCEDLLMWAVPSFLMITGALLLDPDRELTWNKVIRKYLFRMVLALAVFVFLFQAMDYGLGYADTLIPGFLKDLFLGQSWAHMWYLYLMIGLYLMMPFYRMIVRAAGDRDLDILIVILILFTSVLPMLRVAGLDLGFYIPTSLIYPVYLFAGYRLQRRPIPVAASVLLALTGAAGLVVLTMASYGMGTIPTEWMDTLGGDSSLFVVAMSLGLFGLLMRIRIPAGGVVRTVDDCTFGIYLIHMIGIHWIMKWQGWDPYTYGPAAFLGMAVLLFAVSGVITWGIRKITGGILL